MILISVKARLVKLDVIKNLDSVFVSICVISTCHSFSFFETVLFWELFTKLENDYKSFRLYWMYSFQPSQLSSCQLRMEYANFLLEDGNLLKKY